MRGKKDARKEALTNYGMFNTNNLICPIQFEFMNAALF